jgi:hypothetical protein
MLKSNQLKLLLYLVLFVIISSISSCRVEKSYIKSWTNDEYRLSRYPSSEYFVEYLESRYTKRRDHESQIGDFKNRLKEQLAQKIYTNIVSNSTREQFQQKDNSGISYTSRSAFNSIQSSNLRLNNSTIEISLVKRKKIISGIIFIQKREMIKTYFSIVLEELASAKEMVNKGAYEITDEQKGQIIRNIDGKINQIDADKMILSLISDEDSRDLKNKVDNNYSELQLLYSNFKMGYNSDRDKVKQLLIGAKRDYNNNDFQSAIRRLDECLIYDVSNLEAMALKKEYISTYLSQLSAELVKNERAGNYEVSLPLIDRIVKLDNSLQEHYKVKRLELSEKRFRQLVDQISDRIRIKDLTSCNELLGDLAPYSYLNVSEYDNLKNEIDDLRIEKAMREVEILISNKDFYKAFTMCNKMQKLYPKESQFEDLSNHISKEIYLVKKENLLDSRPTRYIIELNFSLSNPPAFVYDNEIGINESIVNDIDVNHLLSNMQFGFYRKIGVKSSTLSTAAKPKFNYSQIGIRAGILNFDNYDVTIDDQNYIIPNYLVQLEASLIISRIVIFNAGVAIDPSDLNSIDLQNNTKYVTSSLGIRIPFGPVSLSTTISGYSNFNQFTRAYLSAGLSFNVGFSKRFNLKDSRSIKMQVENLNDF